MCSVGRALILVALLHFSLVSLVAQEYRLWATLSSPTPEARGCFGNSVSTDGSLFVVGEPFAAASGVSRAGRVHVFDEEGTPLWSAESPSPRSDQGVSPFDESGFGGGAYLMGCVSVDQGTVAVGEIHADQGGKAYLYEDKQAPSVLVVPPENRVKRNLEFGNSVDLRDGFLLVGAYFSGAYLYKETGEYLREFVPESGFVPKSFGMAVAIAGDTVVVTQDHGTVEGARDAGKAYVFARTGPIRAEITAPHPTAGGLFGVCADTDGELLVIGEPGATVDGQIEAGRAHLFNNDGTFLATLVSPLSSGFAGFGTSVALDGNNVVVGAPREDVDGVNNAGAVFVFDRAGELVETLLPPEREENSEFGWSVESRDGLLLVGAPQSAVQGLSAAGKAYLYRR